MRGKPKVNQLYKDKFRITPAYAGKTFLPFAYKDFTQDHPRVCGENSSSDMRAVITCRITPAYAGKTISLCPDSAIAKDHPRVCGENTVWQ